MTKEEILSQVIGKVGGARLGWSDGIYNVANLLPGNCRILEIGAQTGSSAIIAALTVKDRGGMVFSLEPGYVNQSKWPPLYDSFKENIHSGVEEVVGQGYFYKCPGVIVPIPGTSQEILPQWDGRLFDLIIIDGLHNYEGVYWDVQWGQFTKPKAYMLFDDWVVGVEKAALEYFNQHKEWYKIPFDGCPALFVKG